MPPYDLFVSYAHNDNERGQVRELRDVLAAGAGRLLGRELTVFFDEDEIPSMADWEQRIGQRLRESRVFLAIISPSYLDSAFCRHEWAEYVRYEAMRQCLGEGIAPVYFKKLPELETDSDLLREMRKRQWCDLVSRTPDSEVAHRLHGLQEQIVERLGRADRALQSRTNAYPHNPQFVGRVREITSLRKALEERCSVGVVGTFGDASPDRVATALHGLGGMGKTELAIAYAHAFAWDYPGGRWLVNAEGIRDFDLLLRKLVEPGALDITFSDEEQRDPRLAGARVISELQRRPRSLLMLDNVTDPRLLAPDVLMRLPPRNHVHVIATTRLGPAHIGGSPHDHTFIAVDELPGDDAHALVRAHQPQARFERSEDASAARDLVDLLDGYTLAVETAGIYLGRHASGGAIGSYVERLRRDVLDVSEEIARDSTVGGHHRERLLACTLAITFESLSPEQLHILMIGALLPPDQVVLPWVRAVATVDVAWSMAVETLRAFRLFTPGQEDRVVRMHKLIQPLVQRRVASADEGGRLSEALTAHVLERGRLVSDAWEKEQRSRWELLPLQRTATCWLDDKRDSGYELAYLLAEPFNALGRFAEAEFLARKALAFAEAAYGLDSDEVARCANVLGVALTELSRFPEAESQLRRALDLDERRYGSGHPEVAIAAVNVGALLKQMGRFNEAEPILRRAVTLLERSPGVRPLAFAAAHSSLGQFFDEMHWLNEAEDHYRKALALAEKSLGPGHYRLGVFLDNLASVLKTRNRVEEAKDLLLRAAQIAESNFGSEHPSVAIRRNNLAELLREAERFEEAEPLYDEALAITERLRGRDHPEVARILNNLGIVYRETGRPQQAEAAYRRARAIWEASYGPLHQDLAATLDNLAKLLTNLHRYDEAVPLFERAIEIDETLLGKESPHLAPTLSNFAWLLCAMGRPDEAESRSRRQLLIVAKTCEREHSDHSYLRKAASNYLALLEALGLTETIARARVDLVLRGSGFSAFSSTESR